MDQVVKLIPEGVELIGDMEDNVINALYNEVLGLGNIPPNKKISLWRP